MTMTQLTYQVRFTTPAFLGNAEQSAQWRTPPFKALLRHWWRVAVARELDYDHRRIREREGRLFGHAWLEGDRDGAGRRVTARKSMVQLRLGGWPSGRLNSGGWPGGHIERVATTRDGKASVSADVYLGYGPVLPPSKKQGRPQVTIRGAVGIDEANELRLAVPEEADSSAALTATLELVELFGALGSRSRNGWGSLDLGSEDPVARLRGLPSSPLWTRISRPWKVAVQGSEWPHAIGTAEDGRPLVWLREGLSDWRAVMGHLARVRVAIRRAAKSVIGPRGIGGIHLLGYPAGGKWELRGADQSVRLATPLRFKVLRASDGRLAAVAYHTPCGLPARFAKAIGDDRAQWLATHQAEVWPRIHAELDREMEALQ